VCFAFIIIFLNILQYWV